GGSAGRSGRGGVGRFRRASRRRQPASAPIRSPPMRTTLLIGSLLTLATACVSKSEYDRQLANAAALSAEKDSLLSEVVSTSQFIAEVNAEIDKVRDGKPVAAADGEMESLSPM